MKINAIIALACVCSASAGSLRGRRLEDCVSVWKQCSGKSFNNGVEKCCEDGSTCVSSSVWYGQCKPGEPTGPPTAPPTLPPTPPPATPPTTPATTLATPITGFYAWSWVPPPTFAGPAGTNHAVAFTGWATVAQSLSDWQNSQNSLTAGATTWLSVGGGNENGVLTPTNVRDAGSKCGEVQAAGFGGIMFDVEHVTGSSADLVAAFDEAFAACKAAGLLVGVTTSHSAPYDTPTPQTAADLVQAWCANASGDLDVLSPQLYSTGYETAPEFAATGACGAGCGWQLYEGCNTALAPSIVDTSHYAAVQTWAQQELNLETQGFFQWAQN